LKNNELKLIVVLLKPATFSRLSIFLGLKYAYFVYINPTDAHKCLI
jgi:hypothetical protein